MSWGFTQERQRNDNGSSSFCFYLIIIITEWVGCLNKIILCISISIGSKERTQAHFKRSFILSWIMREIFAYCIGFAASFEI